jgi:myotubularin-related protein 1/2
VDDPKFFSRIEDTEWMLHTKRILSAGVHVAEKMELERSSVLIHCRFNYDKLSNLVPLLCFLLSHLSLSPS